MRTREGSSFKKTCLWITIVFCFLLAGYGSLISVLSIYIGLTSAPQPGFWIPVLAGTVCILPVFWALLRVTKLLLSQMAKKNIVRL